MREAHNHEADVFIRDRTQDAAGTLQKIDGAVRRHMARIEAQRMRLHLIRHHQERSADGCGRALKAMQAETSDGMPAVRFSERILHFGKFVAEGSEADGDAVLRFGTPTVTEQQQPRSLRNQPSKRHVLRSKGRPEKQGGLAIMRGARVLHAASPR
jgi:hypothetical protein